jgi:hypothetical protein
MKLDFFTLAFSFFASFERDEFFFFWFCFKALVHLRGMGSFQVFGQFWTFIFASKYSRFACHQRGAAHTFDIEAEVHILTFKHGGNESYESARLR